VTEIVDEVFEFRTVQWIVGLHRVTAHGFGNGKFAEALGIHLLAGGL